MPLLSLLKSIILIIQMHQNFNKNGCDVQALIAKKEGLESDIAYKLRYWELTDEDRKKIAEEREEIKKLQEEIYKQGGYKL